MVVGGKVDRHEPVDMSTVAMTKSKAATVWWMKLAVMFVYLRKDGRVLNVDAEVGAEVGVLMIYDNTVSTKLNNL